MTRVKKIGQVVIYLAAVYFIGKLLSENWYLVRDTFFHLRAGAVSTAIVLMAIGFTWQAYLWYRIIKHYHVVISFHHAWYLYMKTAIVRYIPGNIWGLAARVYMMTQLGIKKSEAAYIMIFESAILSLSGLITYFLLSAALAESALLNMGLALLGLLLLLFIISPQFFFKILRVFKKEISIRSVSVSYLVILLFGYLLYWGFVGLSIYFLTAATTETAVHAQLLIIGIFSISWVIGFMSLITPSGIGVREVSLIFYLSKLISSSLAAAIAVLARLIFTTGELVSLAVAFVVYKINKKEWYDLR